MNTEHVRIPVAERTVHGDVHRAAALADGDARTPVLICADVMAITPAEVSLTQDLVAALVAAGGVVATYEPRGDRSLTSMLEEHTARDFVDDASAVLRHLILRPDADHDRVAIIGVGFGAVIAAELSARTDQIAAVVMLNPPPPDDLAGAGAAESEGVFHASLETLEPTRALLTHRPPVLILHGAADRVSPPSGSMAYAEPLLESGSPIERLLVAHADHAMGDGDIRAVAIEQVIAFVTSAQRSA